MIELSIENAKLCNFQGLKMQKTFLKTNSKYFLGFSVYLVIGLKSLQFLFFNFENC
jgi:hypothetical protein